VDQQLVVDLETESASDTPPSPNCFPENCSHRKRDGSVLMQQDARDELKVISQAQRALLSELPGYAYDSRGGRGITVYVIDTGINQDHQVSVADYQWPIRLTCFQEFQNMLGSIRWLFISGEPEIQGDDIGHGTCVASKVASPSFGVAKSANIVVVRLDPVDGKIPMSKVIAAWAAIAADIASKNMEQKAVVSFSMSGERQRF